MKTKGYYLTTLILVVSCTSRESVDVDTYKLEIETWHADRVERLKSPTGWLSVAGLFWMKEGINTFGSDSTNDFVFPQGKIAAKAGSFFLKDGSVTLVQASGADIAVTGGYKDSQLVFHPDSTGRPPQMVSGPLTWFVIKRDNLLGIRLRDSESEEVGKFQGIERYPVDAEWRIEATLETAPQGKTIDITNVLGQTYAMESPGTLVFEIDGDEYRLDAVSEGDELFIIYGDPTNGQDTYGAGRYVYCKVPGVDGKTILDFNKSTNPPCAFTPYATCPLPPRQNILPVAVLAGEKEYGHENAHSL